ncbi:FAD/NAD(P)-binding domain-containing protein [Rhizopus microsporus var. microsporus]|uniref:FAD/NAD(P)-binding domain-containing protein n=2 Tax=Rhizopus microsporus TaxID=58291 RepID=A0A2G4TBP9_RHIZD|nr:FAD/NAD(P)-binding domain-containing protein [Rhizopus microsporus ATCC 52813]ORE05406.1 FAD/NAD(P)-binding domain-containing protein [Rhizopus microsporus var. microsporus]PHZ18036.1 FAD/NAD(P)-binding domain-containing protein [Rhizopus microsporus ATCC 52813]
MPVESAAIQVQWTSPNKAIVGCNNTSLLNVSSRYEFGQKIRKVAVIGAGPAGLPTAKLLLDEGLQVKIFERNTASGGTWIFHEEKPLNPEFPSEVPTKVVKPSLPPGQEKLPFKQVKQLSEQGIKEELLRLNPPTPCYRSLKNNVPTPLLKYKDLDWPKGTPWFTTHEKILEYLQLYSAHFKLDEITEFNTSVEKLTELPNQSGWKVLTKTAHLDQESNKVEIVWKEETFDAVVVATGHYHAQYVPDFPGLSEWRKKWPSSVIHSKEYREPDSFKDKTVLLIGNGTSALDIARDIRKHAKKIYNSVRESKHGYDERYQKLREEVAKLVPKNVQRVGEIRRFRQDRLEDSVQSAVVELVDGTEITDIDYIIVCTGYLFSFHFLEDLHDDEEINSRRGYSIDEKRVLVKNGVQVFNLHKDIFYIPNPTLSFVGIPFHIATFSLFEFQSYAVARVYSGAAKLPNVDAMRAEWLERARQKGLGREFHALGSELELVYIKDIVNWLNEDGKALGKPIIQEHDQEWIKVRSKSLEALVKSLKLNDD